MIENKRCKTCNLDKPLTEYHKAMSNIDGRAGKCKECTRAAHRRFYKGNYEKSPYEKEKHTVMWGSSEIFL